MAEEPTRIHPPSFEEVPLEPRKESSLLQNLRDMRERAAEEHHFDYEVPGYRGCLVLRLGPISGARAQELRDRALNSTAPDRDLGGNMDTLITACREVLARNEPGGELEPIDPEGGPVRIEKRLGELLGIESARARDVLLGLFDRANAPEIAIGVAANQYIEWAGRADDELDEEFLGESPAARK